MENRIRADLEKYRKIEMAYNTAKKNNDNSKADEMLSAAQQFLRETAGKGKFYEWALKLLDTAKRCGNSHINLETNISEDDANGLINCFRENGVKTFTFSAEHSGAIETAWFFTRKGCTMDGVVEINARDTNIFISGHEKSYAYLFQVN